MESKLHRVPQPSTSTSPSPSPAITPTQFKHYLIGQHLGEGGFGRVFEAWDNKLRRSVAIKQLKNFADAAPAANLIKEAQLAASLQHAAFVKIYALEDDDDCHSIVMELVRGQTLKQLLASTPPDQASALDMVRQVAQAMQEAHDAGLIHGDLKPSNLMVEPSGIVRILDFGLAVQGDADATTSVLQTDPQGTIAYMAPERLLGAPLQRQSDIYALGVILYELLTGARPFANLNGLALAAAHMQSSAEQWTYPAELPLGLVQLIRAMTARDQAQRLQGMGFVLKHLALLDEKQHGLIPLKTGMPDTPPDTSLASTPTKNNAAFPLHFALPRKWQHWLLGSLLGLMILCLGIVYFIPMSLNTTLRPYSESNEMQAGLANLRAYDKPGSLDLATASFEQVLQHAPKHAGAAAGLALVYIWRYASDEQDEIWLRKAQASAQQALQDNNQLALAHVAQARVLDRQGKVEQALRSTDQALALAPGDYYAWQAKSFILHRARRFEEAKQLAHMAMQRFPRERYFADALGSAYYEESNLPEAEKAFRLSLKIEPDAVFAYANLNAVLMAQGRSEEALEILQQGLQVRPSSLLYTNLGNALFVKGDYVNAAISFEHAVSKEKGNPLDYKGWANLGDTLLWLPGRRAEASLAYEKACTLLAPLLARSPQNITLVSRMGLYSRRAGEQARALELTERAIGLAPNNASVQFRAAMVYELSGKRELALGAITKAIKLGYPKHFIDAEPDFLNLRRDPQYPQ